MNNYSKIINQMKEKIAKFSKEISKDLSLPNCKFVLDMTYGLISSSSSFLSEIARSLKEKTSLKKVVERLSNRLANFDKEKRDVVWSNYINEVQDKIDENTVFCFDPGDLGKKYSKKLENIDLIKDGSTGEFINGYKMIEVAALTKNEKLPIPVYSNLFSSTEEEFVSENDEYLTALRYVNNKFGNMGIYALDRGFDDEKYFRYFSEKNLSFVIRMKTNRNITVCKSEKTNNIKIIANRQKLKKQYSYKDKFGITRTATTGYIKIKIPNIDDKEFYLVIIKSSEFPKDPMMLLTNLKPDNKEFTKIVNKVYIRRWKIEEYFKFKKQQFKFEKMILRTLDSIRTLNILLSATIGFIAIFSDWQKYGQYLVVFDAAQSLKSNDKIVLVYYAVERGFNKIFQFDSNGIKNIYSRENTKSEQCILPEFSNFNCFIN